MTKPCLAKTVARKAYRGRVTLRARADASKPSPDETTREDQEKKVERMRSRLEGLFGVEDDTVKTSGKDGFDGVALRNAIRERWGVQYDVQPQKRHGRVYVQVRLMALV